MRAELSVLGPSGPGRVVPGREVIGAELAGSRYKITAIVPWLVDTRVTAIVSGWLIQDSLL